jgi:hypothetical protein
VLCCAQDLEEREAKRAAAAKDSQWQQFIAASRPYVATQVGADSAYDIAAAADADPTLDQERGA